MAMSAYIVQLKHKAGFSTVNAAFTYLLIAPLQPGFHSLAMKLKICHLEACDVPERYFLSDSSDLSCFFPSFFFLVTSSDSSVVVNQMGEK